MNVHIEIGSFVKAQKEEKVKVEGVKYELLLRKVTSDRLHHHCDIVTLCQSLSGVSGYLVLILAYSREDTIGIGWTLSGQSLGILATNTDYSFYNCHSQCIHYKQVCAKQSEFDIHLS